MKKDVKLMKGNEALAHGAIRAGADGYFGYPITPQSEVLECFMEEEPWKTTGMVVLQAESETSSINMVYAGAGIGKKVMTTTSSPGWSLMQEGASYLAGAELPCVVANVMRGGPGLGTIQPSQGDYFQAVKGGGHGDYHFLVLAPNSVQEMADFVGLGFDLAFKYRNPVMILSDGVIGQMMEKVELPEQKTRLTDEEIRAKYPWAAIGHDGDHRAIITSLELQSQVMEENNHRFQAKYRVMEEKEVRYEEFQTEDAEYIIVAFGSSSRIASKVVELCRAEGKKVGMIRPITLWPFPSKRIAELAKQAKGFISVELNAGQMVEDVRLAVNGKVPVYHYGRMGGMIFAPDEIKSAMTKSFGW